MSRPPDSTSSDVSVFASSAGAVNGAQMVAVPSRIRSVCPATCASGTTGSSTDSVRRAERRRRRGRARAGRSTATRTRAPRRGGRCDGSCPGWPSAPTPEGRTRAGEGHPSRDSSLPCAPLSGRCALPACISTRWLGRIARWRARASRAPVAGCCWRATVGALVAAEPRDLRQRPRPGERPLDHARVHGHDHDEGLAGHPRRALRGRPARLGAVDVREAPARRRARRGWARCTGSRAGSRSCSACRSPTTASTSWPSRTRRPAS